MKKRLESYDLHCQAIFRYFRARLDHEQAAEDLTGKVFRRMLAGLPEAEALLLKKAAMLRTIASTAEASNRFAEQRRKLLQLARKSNKTSLAATTVVGKTSTRWLFQFRHSSA